VVHIADISDSEVYRTGDPVRVASVDSLGARSGVWVALVKDDVLFGTLLAFRQEVRPFTEKQIALLQNFAAQAVIAMENARLLGELRERTRDLEESLEYQTATSDVLQVISRSTFDLQPVLESVLETTMRLCGNDNGEIFRLKDDAYHLAAARGLPLEYVEIERQAAILPGRETLVGRTALEARPVQIFDAWTDPEYGAKDEARQGGARTMLGVPLLRDGVPVGVIVTSRSVVKPFTERQIELVRTFADQAVIAMENARLITETREALEQQTATADVLQVINASPGDLTPVFAAIVEKAHTLCGAAFGGLLTYDGEFLRLAATHNLPAAFAELGSHGFRPGPKNPLSDLICGEPLVHIPDLSEVKAAAPDDPIVRASVDLGGIRTLLAVPLRKDGALLGVITAYRQEVKPFSDKQIALLQNFAAQAVIAMENARLLTETREALEQQTATADVLQVINASPGDLAPVFDAMLEKAKRLCEAAVGSFWTFDGQAFHVMASTIGDIRNTLRPSPKSALGRLVTGEGVVHTLDVAEDEWETADAEEQARAERAGTRTLLAVPLRKEGNLIGAITAGRREVRAFSDKQIALLQNFAAQAVIAMENARLLTETREALQQQTATAEVLQVINSSPGDLTPVFEAILQKAHSLCGAAHGTLVTYDGEYARAVATQGVAEPLTGLLRQPFRPLSTSPLARLVREHCVIHIPDQAAEAQWGPNDPRRIATAEGGVRTMLFVPLRKDETVIGWIAANRLEVRPFSEKEITLLESFAARAVIAMDNARLLDEIRQRQAELRVTFDNMGDGVAMFDSELRLAAWNLNFQRILELPDPLLAERPRVADFVRYLATHGEYGAVDVETEVRRLSQRVGTQWSNERTRPDGRVIEVRSNSVPGGGWC
jgi:GAF domain-containing protein